MRSKRLILAAGACLAALSLITPTALADPTGPVPPPFRDLVGSGSDTTQDVLNALSNVITIGGVKPIGSYDASGSATIQTKASGCSGIPRPSGSSAGVGRLQDSLEGVSFPGCFQFARSSADNSASFPANPPGGAGRLSYVPFAVDAVTYVIRDDSPLPNSLTVADLRSIYDCALPTTDVRPLLPQATSGTRQFFLQQLGYTATEISNFNSTTHPCVNFTQATLENTGTLITDPLNVAPYSVAQYQSQINREIPDVHGRTILGKVDNKPSTVLNTGATMKRDVYNVIPTNQEGTAPTSTVFVGPSSLVCQNTATINRLGFGTAPNCGVITIRTS